MSAAEARKTGRVKFFNSAKGYGFILPDTPSDQSDVEVFVHHTAIHNDGGFKSLGEDEEVEYDLVQGNKGMQAANVTGIGGGPVKGDPRAGQQRPPFQNGRHPYNSGYTQDPYSSGGYKYNMAGGVFPPYATGGGNQYGQPMYDGQQQFGYQQQPLFGMQQQHGLDRPDFDQNY